MIVVGLAGGIASGKSIISRIFENLGGVIINADMIGHETLTMPHVQDRLIDIFGQVIVGPDGAIDRSVLGRIVFSDSEAKEQLEGIVRTPIIEEIRRRIEQQRVKEFNGVVVVDAALLVEWNEVDLVDVLIIVTAPEPMRIARLAKRNRLTPKEAKLRIDSQLKDEDRVPFADYVIDNRGTVDELEAHARELWERIVNDGVEY